MFHPIIQFLEDLRDDYRAEAFAHPKLTPGKKAGMTGLARAVLMVCSVDAEFEDQFNQFCKRLGAFVAAKAKPEEYQRRLKGVKGWIASGDFGYVSAWVDGAIFLVCMLCAYVWSLSCPRAALRTA